jgi:hypothetical protein
MDFVKFIRGSLCERSKHKKGTLNNNLYKLILNSLYERFALGLQKKNYFNSRTGAYEPAQCSGNTNPFIASLTTDFIRAVLSELADELVNQGYSVISMTTDGLITNYPFTGIRYNVNTPLVERFKNYTDLIGVGRDNWLELKISTEELFSWKTRTHFANSFCFRPW